jgi:hypothetical protein
MIYNRVCLIQLLRSTFSNEPIEELGHLLPRKKRRNLESYWNKFLKTFVYKRESTATYSHSHVGGFEILAQELINGQERVHAGTLVTVSPHKSGRTRCHLGASGHKLQRRLIPQSIHPSLRYTTTVCSVGR